MKSLSKKPFYSSKTIIILFPLLVFLLNIALVPLFGAKVLDEYRIDKIFHVVGGVAISVSIAGVLWHLVSRGIIGLQEIMMLRFLVFGFLCFVVISWEIAEYIFLFPVYPEYVASSSSAYSDTVTDMIWGLVGGLFAMFLIRRPVG
jgi:hypothetical protein